MDPRSAPLDPLALSVKKFLTQHCQSGDRLLLGLSGGSDSLALLHLLVECRRFVSFELELAHIDHRWREESKQEALELASIAQQLNLVFHLKTLTPPSLVKKDLENRAREERLHFFEEIYQRGKFNALLLAHQAEDAAETTLKRIFEGAGLCSLAGLQSVTKLRGMHTLRPLLHIPKENLVNWLKMRGMQGFYDKTNADPRFLRARMRTHMFPDLEKQFGKQVVGNVLRLSGLLKEVACYLEKKTQPLLAHAIIETGPFGEMLDLNPFFPIEELELMVLVRTYCEERELVFSREVHHHILDCLQNKAANKSFPSKGGRLIVDRGSLFWIKKEPPLFSERALWHGEKGSYLFKQGDWEWKISCQSEQASDILTGWKNLWKGRAFVSLPIAEYEVFCPCPKEPFLESSSIKREWVQQRVPAFLRPWIPCISIEGKIVHDFLTGRSVPINKQSTQNILFEIKNNTN